jgi:integrase
VLTELFVRKVRPEASALNVWDLKERGLVLRVQPSGRRAFKFVYSRGRRKRWYHLGPIGLADARKLAAEIRLDVVRGRDPAQERKAQRSAGTFADLAASYVELHARKRNKSWRQADALVKRFLLPRWGKLQASAISRSDVRMVMSRIDRPVLANAVLAAASAVFSWAVKQELVAVNPCRGIERNAMKSRERVLSESEVAAFWPHLSAPLKIILLTGARPGEVTHMHREHIRDGWWELPGAPAPELNWPGTKNGASHRIPLSKPAIALLDELFDGSRRAHMDAEMRAICGRLGIKDRIRPHDLRRSFATTVAALGYGRQAVDRLLNHADRSVASVYDRHSYAREDQQIVERVARHILELAEGRGGGATVITFQSH